MATMRELLQQGPGLAPSSSGNGSMNCNFSLPSNNCNLSLCSEECGCEEKHFLDGSPDVLPSVYLSFSCLSAFCCAFVFLTYFSFPRLKRHSSKVFLYRTGLNLFIAFGHIIVSGASLHSNVGCAVFGALNQFALFAAELWYLMLAWDLLRAIRNPFSPPPSTGVPYHVAIWGFSLVSVVIVCASHETGLSMFYWCWVTIDNSSQDDNQLRFLLLTLILYYLPHIVVLLLCLVSFFWSVRVLYGRLIASSETRKFILKQNAIYIIVLGIDTTITVPIWIAQLFISWGDRQLFFCNDATLALSVTYAVAHSLRGFVDLVVWWLTFSIGWRDVKGVYLRLKHKWKHNLYLGSSHTNKSPLVKADDTVNKSLRRDIMYCINYGILDAVQLTEEEERNQAHLGSVRDPFVAQAMVMWDAANRESEVQKELENPHYKEETTRKIHFPPSSSLRDFGFIDVEPSIFSMLRNTYSTSSRAYRDSFKIKNAMDIDSSGMLEKFTEGRSGSFFYFTRDFKYIIKTVTASEEAFLQKIAYQYYRHMQKNPNSVIVRLFGLHKVRLAPEQAYIRVLVMENIFYNKSGLKINECYDLKGSTVSRRVLKGGKTQSKHRGTLKDLDLQRRIVIGAENKAHLLEQLREDVSFLMGCRIMDYSLLLGIHLHGNSNASLHHWASTTVELAEGTEGFVDLDSIDLTTWNERRRSRRLTAILESGDVGDATGSLDQSMSELHIPWFRRDFGGLRSYSPCHPCSQLNADQRSVSLFAPPQGYKGLSVSEIPVATYYFGMVDILQQYNFSKKVEHLFKTRLLCKDRHGISSVNEREYGDRFLKAMDNIFE